MLELGREARNRGYEVDILAADPEFGKAVVREGFGLIDLDVIRREIRPVFDTRGLMRLSTFLARSPYSIVHTHTSKPGLIGTCAARRSGTPAIVHTPHLLPFHEESGPGSKAVYLRAARMTARWCDRIVTVSDHQREWMLETRIGREDQVVSIPNGLPADRAWPQRSRAEVRADLRLGDAFTILSTGRLAEQKGLEYLIRAAATLRGRLPSFRVLLAGQGPLEARLAQLIFDLQLGDVVTILGHRDDVGDLLVACDLVALPSLWEGLSISLLEAMAAARPVVTTSIGSNREVTNDGEGAVLVPPKDTRALANAIVALSEDPASREQLARAGERLQRQRYTLQRMLDAYFEQYEAVLAA